MDFGTPFDQQGLLQNRAAYVARIQELIALFRSSPSGLNSWSQMYDRDGVARYVINISHSAQKKRVISDTHVTFGDALQAVADEVLGRNGVRVGFTLDPWEQTSPDRINVTPGSSPTTKPAFLGLQGFLTGARFWHIAKDFACQDKANRVHTDYVNGEPRYSVYANEHDLVMKQIADGKKDFLRSWINSGVPVFLDVDPGYDATKLWGEKVYEPLCSGNDRPGMLADTGRTGSPVFDRWRNVQSEFKGQGVKGIVFNSWNGYTEGMVAQDTIEHNTVERRWLTDLLRADPRLCDHYYYSSGTVRYHVYGAICMKYVERDVGGEYGVLGPPIGDAGPSALPGIAQQPFTQGRVYWDGSKPTEVHGAIFRKYEQMGLEAKYGYPTTDQKPIPYNTFRAYSDFYGGGSIYYSEFGTYAMYGAINQYYVNNLDRGAIRCGAVRGDAQAVGAAAYQQLERGRIYWNWPGRGSTFDDCP
jgi:hypothetical protein